MQWYVVRTKPKKEFLACRFFDKMNIESYVVSSKILNKNKKTLQKILLPSYIFTRLQKLEYSTINQNPYTGSVLTYLGQPAMVTNQEIIAMRNHIESIYTSEDFSNKAVGSIVSIDHGSFTGQKGEIISRTNNKISIRLFSIGMVITISLN